MWTESSKKNEFLERLHKVRGDQSVRKFAKMLSMSSSTVAEYMNGREPPVSFVVRVCERFEVSPSWLLFGKSAQAEQAAIRETMDSSPKQAAERIVCLPDSASHLKGCMVGINIKFQFANEPAPLMEIGDQVLLEVC